MIQKIILEMEFLLLHVNIKYTHRRMRVPLSLSLWIWAYGGKETVIAGGKPLNAVVKHLAKLFPPVAWKVMYLICGFR